MARCPICGKETENSIKEWGMSKIHVKLYECCGKKFREYVKIIQDLREVFITGLLDRFRRRKKPREEKALPDEEKVLERTRKLRAEVEEHVKEKPQRKAKKEK